MVTSSGSRKRARQNCGCGLSALLSLLSFGALLVSPASGARESSKGYDADLTLFSPEGRLYQVEYVMRAVGHYGCPAVGVHGEDCCVVACRRDLPDELVYPESVSSIYRVTDDIYTAATGMTGDVRYQVKRARLQALEYKRLYGSPMPSRLLTLAMADAAQVNTQHAALRPMACVSLVISVDDPTGPALFRVEPSGQVFQAWGTAAGRGSAACMEFLEEAFKAAAMAEEGEGEGEARNRRGATGNGTGSAASASAGNGDNMIEESSSSAFSSLPAGAEADSVPFGTENVEGDGVNGKQPGSGEETEEEEAGGGGRRDDDGQERETEPDDAAGSAEPDGAVASASERGAPRSRREGVERQSQATEPPGARSSGSGRGGVATSRGAIMGFGAVLRGERETVQLALQALSKASSGKGALPLTDRNVEIAIASRETGIRVCSRKEVRSFLGKMAFPVAGCAPTSAPL